MLRPACLLLASTMYYWLPLSAQPLPAIETEMPLRWKTRIGNTTFRSNMLLHNGELYIGSNGTSYKDYSVIDETSGVYVLDSRSGRVKRHFAHATFGDMDVNGLMMYNNRLYFGNDNEEFLCTDLNGTILWRLPASGDVEHEPVLLNIRGRKVVVYASESGEVRAVDPAKGATVWSYFIPEFQGWKPGDNRTVFKVQAWFSNTLALLSKPLVADLNSDGVTYLIYPGYNDKVYAVSGATGRSLWTYSNGNMLDLSAALGGTAVNPTIMLTSRIYSDSGARGTYLLTLSKQGHLLQKQLMDAETYGAGLNTLQLPGTGALFTNAGGLALIDKTGSMQSLCRNITYLWSGKDGQTEALPRSSGESLLSTATFRWHQQQECIAILHQNDNADRQHGFLEVIDIHSRQVLHRLLLPSTAEMPPVVCDTDGDGKPELLISCRDRMLYCFSLPYNTATP